MVFVGVLALQCTDLHFIDAGVKINGQYHLMQKFPRNVQKNYQKNYSQITSPSKKIRSVIFRETHAHTLSFLFS